MNRVVFASLIILCLLSISSITGLVHLAKADVGTIYIYADGSIGPSTAPIYSADKVTYTLTGNINVTSDTDGIDIERSNIVLDGAGYTVNGSGLAGGIRLTGTNNVTVRNMTITNFDIGISLDSAPGFATVSTGNSSDNNVLSGNNITNNGLGIGLGSADDNTLSGNNITANWIVGIELLQSDNNTLSGNVMGNEHNLWVSGTVLSDFLQSIDTSNLVNGKPVYYFVNQSNIIVNPEAYPEVGYLGFANCVNVTVQGMNLTNNGQGLLLAYTNGSEITGNDATNNFENGIDLEYSSNNTLSGNNVTANTFDGIDVEYSSGNVLSGNNVTANNFGGGIYLYSSSKSTLSGNNVTNNFDGIGLDSSSDNTLSGNNVTANTFEGIYLQSSSENTLSGDNVTANIEFGIYLQSSPGNTLSGNVMVDNKYNFYVEGSASLGDWFESVDTSNLVDGKPVYYFMNQSNIAVNPDAYPEVGYLGFVNCANVTVQGMNLTNSGQGVQLAFTNDSTVTNNNIANNWYGIWLFSSSNNSVSGNNITASGNVDIYLQYYSSNNSISGNNITGTKEGIELDDLCNYNSVLGNNITNHQLGLDIWLSSNNNIYQNDLVNNSGQVISYNSTNVWDNGSAGNYWSDYLPKYPNATETDGVWNTPYVIDSNNTDYYPLTVPYATVPEFPTIQATMLFMLATLLAVIIYKKKGVKARARS
ncbi:MAG: NosD domain-containing protein [Candidatus Bathyarchaeia archaeon]|jgi:parallel beta-helix repeat protein